MKLNKILMALAAVAFVGCSSEDVSDFAANQAVEDSGLIQLDPNFVIAGAGEDGDVTRTHWEYSGSSLVNKFLPIWATAPTGGNTIDVDADLAAQAVGLCWLGNGTVGTDVYTNYEFYHFGWLQNGQNAPVFECNDLTNGALYNEINVAAGDAAGAEATTGNFSFAVAKPFAIGALNYNSGIYKTENKAIFGGDYIVYYPYNEDFKNAGTIPALAETEFNNVSESFDAPEVGHATFRYSRKVNIEGGSKAAGFGLRNLSTLVQLRVATPSTLDLSASYDIDKIILYSAKEQLLKQANLAADKIVAGEEGTDLYTATEGTKTIVANFTAPVALKRTNATPTSAYITVLPTTVEDLVVLVHSASQKKWAKVSKPNTEFKAGNAMRLDITINSASDFKTDYIAVDEATLTTARNEARAAGGNKTITVIGDITLSGIYDLASHANDPKITIKGDDIIVPEDVTLNTKAIIQSNLRLLGKSCCTGTNGAILNIQGGTVNNVTMEKTEANATTKALYDQYNPTVNYTGAATVAAGKNFIAEAGNINVNAAVQHKGNITIAEGVTLTVSAAGDLNFMGSTVENNGIIEVEKNGQFDMTDANGNATANDGKRMTNNGKFIHNVDAGVGTAVQSMNQNGEYRCKVDDQIKLDDAYLQWLACSVIEMVNTSAINYNLTNANQHNGKYIDIEVNATAPTTFDNPSTGSNGDSKNIQIGNLTVTAGSLDIKYVKGTGKRTLTVNGDMTVKDDTQLTNSNKIVVTGNLTVEGSGKTLTYKGNKANGALEVAKNITVTRATFDADEIDALNITCANFYLKSGATAKFGNRNDGDAHNMDVAGTIANPSGCTFDVHAANQSGGSVLAWITCKSLTVGGTFTNARPRVVE